MASPTAERSAAVPAPTRPFVSEITYFDNRARGLVSAYAEGLSNALAQIRTWHPSYAGAKEYALRSRPFTLDDARLVYARQHGFENWERFASHIDALAKHEKSEPFLDAFEALKRHDKAALQEILADHPDLVHARGTNANTLLHLACSVAPKPASAPPPRELRSLRAAAHSGDESGRRSVPKSDAVADAGENRTDRETAIPTHSEPAAPPDPLGLIRVLLDAGADVDAANDRGWTPMHHPCYANLPEMASLFLDHDAALDISAHGEGGTPLAVALFWGNREVAETIAAIDIVPRNLRTFAGLGRRALVERCFDASGKLLPDAGAARKFYRPHSGFPVWQPSNDPQEILDEALVWAAKSDRVSVMPLLVERGARVSADPYRGTPLLWAAFCGRIAAATWLLDHGANPNQTATFGGPEHGQGVTALHLAATHDDLPMVRLLIERGADRSLVDDVYFSTPLGWADHFGASQTAAHLRSVR